MENKVSSRKWPINYINLSKSKAESGKGRKGKEKRKKNKHHLPLPEINDMHLSLVSEKKKKKKKSNYIWVPCSIYRFTEYFLNQSMGSDNQFNKLTSFLKDSTSYTNQINRTILA